MGISLEDVLHQIDILQEKLDYYCLCHGKEDDKNLWESRLLVLRGHIQDSYDTP